MNAIYAQHDTVAGGIAGELGSEGSEGATKLRRTKLAIPLDLCA
jgi:hypothetical protein